MEHSREMIGLMVEIAIMVGVVAAAIKGTQVVAMDNNPLTTRDLTTIKFHEYTSSRTFITFYKYKTNKKSEKKIEYTVNLQGFSAKIIPT